MPPNARSLPAPTAVPAALALYDRGAQRLLAEGLARRTDRYWRGRCLARAA